MIYVSAGVHPTLTTFTTAKQCHTIFKYFVPETWLVYSCRESQCNNSRFHDAMSSPNDSSSRSSRSTRRTQLRQDSFATSKTTSRGSDSTCYQNKSCKYHTYNAQ